MRRSIVVLMAGVALAACAAGSSTETSPSAPTSTAAPSTITPTSAAPTTDAADTTVVATTDDVVAEPAEVTVVDGELFDEARDRRIPYRMYVPADTSGDVPIVLVSHGGFGSDAGHLTAGHLGATFADGGFAAIHIGHVVSNPGARPIHDRPADVTFVLDRIDDGTIALPEGSTGALDLGRVGHTGHSFGAYTAHAVGGATFEQTFTDERVDAIAPLSPQGPDQFGAFDRGPADSTWSTVTIPVYDVIGEDEIDSNAVDSIERPGWRLVPFERYPGTSDTFETILMGQDHSDLWRTGSDEVESFVADNVLAFFRRYVLDDDSIDACTIGAADPTFATTEFRAASDSSPLGRCA